MAEYIEREALCKWLHETMSAQTTVVGMAYVRDFWNRVLDAPAADVAPVGHAEWVVCGDGENVPWMCSHCGKTTAHKYKTMYGKYCPNCGAHMKDGE